MGSRLAPLGSLCGTRVWRGQSCEGPSLLLSLPCERLVTPVFSRAWDFFGALGESQGARPACERQKVREAGSGQGLGQRATAALAAVENGGGVCGGLLPPGQGCECVCVMWPQAWQVSGTEHPPPF